MSGPDPYEIFTRWYLRFNGYLAIENFVVHEPIEGGVRPGTETDILAVRFPFSLEEPGFRLDTDEQLVDAEAGRERLRDFVIAEVKSNDEGLNKIWRDPIGEPKLELVRYLLRWLGPLENAKAIDRAAELLQRSHRAKEESSLFRIIRFAPGELLPFGGREPSKSRSAPWPVFSRRERNAGIARKGEPARSIHSDIR